MTITGEAHASPITGGVDGARDRRRLASNCNSGWCVCPPRPCFPPLRNLAAAFLSAADHTARRQTATHQRTTSGMVAGVAISIVGWAAMVVAATPAALTIMLPAVDATNIPLTQAETLATPPAAPAVPVALLGHTAPRSMSLVAPRALAEPPSSPCPRTVPPHHHHRFCATPRHLTPTNRCTRVCAQGRGRTIATLTAPARRPRAILVRPAPHHSTSIATARQGGLKPATAPARRARSAPHHSTRSPAARRAA